jgi:cellulose synthase/poly-beta-1,6-N-acetylglucosamine synthase-like glycosyltransferase
MRKRDWLNKHNISLVVVALLLMCIALAIFLLMPVEAYWIVLGFVVAIIVYYFVRRLIQGKEAREEKSRFWQNLFSLLSIFALMLVVFAVILRQTVTSVFIYILLVSLVFTMVMNFITVPLAVIHKIKERRSVFTPPTNFPRVSVIVPAYNEEKVLARTIENLLEADYPDKEIIVVDDGSKDDTYEIATRYHARGIKVVHRPNGGKFAALNTGLVYATGEIIVTMDADSQISRLALREIVRGFENPDVSGVAGNLTVFNRNKLITKLQALEYIIQIQVIRRAFENFGAITVASGAFSAFRREALDNAGRYDPDFLLEDFDITIKLLKSQKLLQGSNEALCYTEAPETLRDVYKQRLSWFRGDFQNFWKHRDAFFNPRFGFMHRLTFPYMLLSMTLVPVASIVVIATTIGMILTGNWIILVYAFILFILLQIILSILGILIAEDDLKLVIYSPLFIIGYKHFLEFAMIKAFFDIVISRGRYVRRERVARIGS